MHCGHLTSIIKKTPQLAFCNCCYRQCFCNWGRQLQSWVLRSLGKISTQVFLSNDSKLWLGTSKYFMFFSPASRTQDKETKHVNFIFISMIKWHFYWLFIMLPLLLWTEPIEFPLALKKPRNWNRIVDTALLYKLSDSYCKKGTVIKSTASPCEMVQILL